MQQPSGLWECGQVGWGAELAQWEVVYNTVRPHQALGYLTPREFLDRWNHQHPEKEEVSRGTADEYTRLRRCG